jgi:hypothetical protein
VLIGQGSSGSGAASPSAKHGAGPVGRLLQSIRPRRLRSKSAVADETAKLKKLAKHMAKGKSGMKIRRSRLPLVVALLSVLLACGGYMIYRSVTVPHVSHVAKRWLDNTSGHHVVHKAHKRSKHHLAHHHKKRHGKLAHRHKKHHGKLAHHKKKKHVQTASYSE